MVTGASGVARQLRTHGWGALDAARRASSSGGVAMRTMGELILP